MQVHLVDGTYELFRHHFALPSHVSGAGQEVAATRGVLGSMFGLLEDGATHVGIATDHVIESFRNDLWPGYKTSAGMPPELLSQFPLLEEALVAAGFAVFPMVAFEADDALGAAAAVAAADPTVDQVLICTPDKDLGQCVVDDRVVQYDRRKDVVYDAAGVEEKFGVAPASIPDYLALVGDSADGFPGLPGWGAKSAATVLARYRHLEDVPRLAGDWDITVRSGAKLAATLHDQLDLALLFRRIATIDTDAPTIEAVSELEWAGVRPEFVAVTERLEAPALTARAERLAPRRR
jgi:5'-3' exonuclease